MSVGYRGLSWVWVKNAPRIVLGLTKENYLIPDNYVLT
jgi:hypothetical protein